MILLFFSLDVELCSELGRSVETGPDKTQHANPEDSQVLLRLPNSFLDLLPLLMLPLLIFSLLSLSLYVHNLYRVKRLNVMRRLNIFCNSQMEPIGKSSNEVITTHNIDQLHK